jgi:hypothetical protein
MGPPHNLNVVRTSLREDRQRWMRTTYGDIIVDREAWDGPRPDWL